MTSLIIGISSAMLLVLLLTKLKYFDGQLVYGIVLACIGFLYIGFTWTDLQSLIINALQALVFVVLAYFGIKRNIYILAIGYFLHGSWDILYNLLDESGLIPPLYDLFCLSFDFTVGVYLLVARRKAKQAFKIDTI